MQRGGGAALSAHAIDHRVGCPFRPLRLIVIRQNQRESRHPVCRAPTRRPLRLHFETLRKRALLGRAARHRILRCTSLLRLTSPANNFRVCPPFPYRTNTIPTKNFFLCLPKTEN